MEKHKTGILMHISSLPSNYGIGTFGKSAYEFVDFLVTSGQTYWQLLPLGQTSYGDSPYQSFSTFAGNPYFIDLDFLVIDGYLEEADLENLEYGTKPEYVYYAQIYNNRYPVLRKAYANFIDHGNVEALNAYCEKEKAWLDNYALFMALKNAHGGKSWREWEKPYYSREEAALAEFAAANADEMGFWKFLQYEFNRQWHNLRNYANDRGIKIIGDLPIYVADDSSDVWANPELFDFDENLVPHCVAGCPPDEFAVDGQLWGNPVYDWEYNKKTGYKWWINRLQSNKDKYDILRIDHFRGFAGYYCVPYGDDTAKNGKWKKGPAMDLFSVVNKELDGYPIIAEDLGFLTEDVTQLLSDCGYPGMHIMEFAFAEGDYYNASLPHNLPKHCVCYTGTHDNHTVGGWLETLSEGDEKHTRDYMNIGESDDFIDSFIKMTLGTVAETVIIPMQDWLGLGAEARMNIPSTSGGNWQWRMLPGQASEELCERIFHHTRLYGRLR